MTGLNWLWIGVMVGGPPWVAAALAYPLWRRGEAIFGSLLGSAVIFAAAFGVMFREHAELERLAAACVEAGTVCFPVPAAFTRHAIYVAIALLEVFGLFLLSLRVERTLRDRMYAPEWR